MKIIGENATPDQIRKHLTKIDLKTCQNDAGEWVSPITGETFDTFYALTGHVGSKLRKIELTKLTEDRKGYIKAVRRGEEPTQAQREANRKYMREYRNNKGVAE